MQQSQLAGCLSAGLLYAVSGFAHAACDFDIEVDDSMAFQIQQMVAEKGCDAIKVTIQHMGQLPAQTMGHMQPSASRRAASCAMAGPGPSWRPSSGTAARPSRRASAFCG